MPCSQGTFYLYIYFACLSVVVRLFNLINLIVELSTWYVILALFIKSFFYIFRAQRNLYRYVVQTVYVIRWIPMEVLGLKGSADAQKLLLLGNPPLAPPLFIQRMGTQLWIEIGSIRYKNSEILCTLHWCNEIYYMFNCIIYNGMLYRSIPDVRAC